MSSGHGIYTKQGRCYPFWTEFRKCRDQDDVLAAENCRNYLEDYMECLHHFKERKRLITIIKALEAPTTGEALAKGDESALPDFNKKNASKDK